MSVALLQPTWSHISRAAILDADADAGSCAVIEWKLPAQVGSRAPRAMLARETERLLLSAWDVCARVHTCACLYACVSMCVRVHVSMCVCAHACENGH